MKTYGIVLMLDFKLLIQKCNFFFNLSQLLSQHSIHLDFFAVGLFSHLSWNIFKTHTPIYASGLLLLLYCLFLLLFSHLVQLQQNAHILNLVEMSILWQSVLQIHQFFGGMLVEYISPKAFIGKRSQLHVILYCILALEQASLEGFSLLGGVEEFALPHVSLELPFFYLFYVLLDCI